MQHKYVKWEYYLIVIIICSNLDKTEIATMCKIIKYRSIYNCAFLVKNLPETDFKQLNKSRKSI